ncbi:MAG: trehalase family glycosidase [Polaribacter sp.]|nr:trehalase family glycosidase [Polaribacter sp.]
MKTKIFISLMVVLLFSNCKKEEKIAYLSFSENSLDYTNTPTHKFDKSGLMFSDQGAWFGYSFPDTTATTIGFSGPFLMTQQNGIWSSAALAHLNIEGVLLKKQKTTAFNSHLEQFFVSENIELKQTLVFSSGHSTLIKTEIKNTSSKSISLKYHWKQEQLLADGLQLEVKHNEVTLSSSKSTAVGHLIFPKGTQLSVTDSTYTSNIATLELKPKQSKEFTISQSFIFPEYSWKEEQTQLKNTTFDAVLKTRKAEKERQIKALITHLKPQFQDNAYAEVLAKAHLTLQNNWRIPAGEIKHEGLFPSYHYKWFNGFWSWDSWKHAVGLSYYDTSLAKKQVQLMFEFQNEDGFIVDCVFRDTLIEKHNYRDTKPPLSAWAVANIYEKDKDLDFIKELYPKLKKYHEWWYNKRDHDQDGLCEYGSTDGSLIAAKWESGMDNAIRFDDSKIVKNSEGAYSLDQESVDLNAYLYAEKIYLALLAEALHKNEDAKKLKKEAELLKTRIQTQFYDKKDDWFYDTNLEGNTFIKGEGSEGWTALWANAATQKQAEAVKNNMMNPKKFFTKVPFQTMSAAHKKFNPLKGYWRGPNWLDQAYFGVKGLRNYGFNTEADKATIQIIKGAEGVLEKGKSIRENYHPITGEGLNAQSFSWSAAHIIMLLVNE